MLQLMLNSFIKIRDRPKRVLGPDVFDALREELSHVRIPEVVQAAHLAYSGIVAHVGEREVCDVLRVRARLGGTRDERGGRGAKWAS